MLNTHRRVRVSRLKEEARAQYSPAVACALTQPKNHHIRIYLTSFVVNTDVTGGTMSAEDAPTTPFASPRLLDESTPPLSSQPPLNASASTLMLQKCFLTPVFARQQVIREEAAVQIRQQIRTHRPAGCVFEEQEAR